ncbi:hypothetical protein OSB04_016225 [Centaurea solstitialis]|uniref:Uncharacterized protein n=1 Tax=Centaurea solstitialis TaxID=347529 RepID=A0AA38T0I6_9ASTR|nr:hypothetical protein OSB04_016225 [Centaurea solstitialis]
METTINTSNNHLTIKQNKLEVESDQTEEANEIVFDYAKRAQWLRAALLGANDGLLSTSSLMMGVGAVREDVKTMVLSGVAGLVAGACSMAIGEFVSVSSQYDIEMSQIEREIIRNGGSSYESLEGKKNELPSPTKAAVASASAFAVGAAVPLVAATFVSGYRGRLAVMVAAVSMALVGFGGLSAVLGRAPVVKSTVRVLVGGWVAMGVTYGFTKAIGSTAWFDGKAKPQALEAMTRSWFFPRRDVVTYDGFKEVFTSVNNLPYVTVGKRERREREIDVYKKGSQGVCLPQSIISSFHHNRHLSPMATNVTFTTTLHDSKTGTTKDNDLDIESQQTPEATEEVIFDYAKRAQWLRAALLGANDGLLSTASLMMGVGAVREDRKAMILSGVAGLVAGACSMAIGEFVSVYSQYDIEISQIQREMKSSGNTNNNNNELEAKKKELPSPAKAAGASGSAFAVGAAVPLLAAGFIRGYYVRVGVLVAAVSVTLVGFGGLSAVLGRAPVVKSTIRVLVGGLVAMGVTYGLTKAVGSTGLLFRQAFRCYVTTLLAYTKAVVLYWAIFPKSRPIDTGRLDWQ